MGSPWWAQVLSRLPNLLWKVFLVLCIWWKCFSVHFPWKLFHRASYTFRKTFRYTCTEKLGNWPSIFLIILQEFLKKSIVSISATNLEAERLKLHHFNWWEPKWSTFFSLLITLRSIPTSSFLTQDYMKINSKYF